MPDELQGYDAIRVLREHEGYREKPYCDLCGKPWMECAGKRERYLAQADIPLPNQVTNGPAVISRRIAQACVAANICPGGTITWGIGQTYTTKRNARDFTEWRMAEISGELRQQDFTPDNIGAARFEGLKHMCYQLGSLRDWPRFVNLMQAVRSLHQSGTFPTTTAHAAALELLWKDGSTKQDRSDWWEQEEPAPNRCEKIAEIIRENQLPEEWLA